MLGIPYTIQQVAELSHAKDLFQGIREPQKIQHVYFDSRTILHGRDALFVAIKTEHRDGHDFIPEAYEKGVRNFIVHKPFKLPNCNYILAENSVEALQLWARNHRKQFSYPVVGITGSNGKTTVKEWLATLLEWEFEVVKSPLSYNSQLGVPLSVLQMHTQASCAIIEAGLSQAGEMEVLREIIQPTLGILTHMGDAHETGFPSFDAKLTEKCLLFEGVPEVLSGSGQKVVVDRLLREVPTPFWIGEREQDDLRIRLLKETEHGQLVELRELTEAYTVEVPIKGQAARENIGLAIGAARKLGLSLESLLPQLGKIHPIYMRSEIITDNPEITLINDSYNSDVESVRTALHLLDQIETHPNKLLIITDMHQQGKQALSRHKQVYDEAISLFGDHKVYAIGPIFGQLAPLHHFPDTESLLASVTYAQFVDHTVLLKGARHFRLERLLHLLNRKQNAALFRIDLNLLVQNFKTLQSRLPAGTKTMSVVKASSYGNGTWEIARELESAGTHYLAVAYTSEGIALREGQIQLPIMVMNPDIDSVPALVDYGLEPEVSNLRFLERYLRYARISERHTYRIHLKLETGMGRLGFVADELPALCRLLAGEPQLEVVSMMSHLAAADEPKEDAFTHEQVNRFENMAQFLTNKLGIFPFRHILNSKGVLRFPEYAFEMVRLGAGLYGINTTGVASGLEEIGRLSSSISQVRSYAQGVSIGYGRAEYTRRPTLIATVALGYADGIPRNLGCGAYAFLVHGKKAPIVGRVCMDMTMIDVTDISGAKAGDEVVVFGKQNESFLSVEEMAEAAGTIPYEMLVRIGSRVRRSYVRGG